MNLQDRLPGDLPEDLDDVLAALVDNTAESIAGLLALPCPDDPGNRLRLLALLREATSLAIVDTLDDAARSGYPTSECADLLSQPRRW